MIETIFITVMALVLLAYVAVPLFFPQQADTLPDNRDPRLAELEGERDALLRAIQELEYRHDLAENRREQLRARYEAKAAMVLRALDARQQELNGIPVSPVKPASQRRFPFIAVTLLTLMVASAAALGGWVLPRLGSASVTTFFEDDLQAAQDLRKLQREAERKPSVESLVALGDAYWFQGQINQDDDLIQQSADTYLQAAELGDLPAQAAYNLGFVQVRRVGPEGLPWLEQAVEAEPDNPEFVLELAAMYYQMGFVDKALEQWRAYQASPYGQDDPEIDNVVAEAERIAPAAKAVQRDPSEENLLELGEVLWDLQSYPAALGVYFQLLQDANPNNLLALSRMGQALFFTGNTEQAVIALSRARELEQAQNLPQLDTLLFLGNAYFSLDSYEAAIEAWQAYVQVAGGEARAGRVPQLIQQAQDALAGTASEVAAGENSLTNQAPSLSGLNLYGQQCSMCHGASGQGGTGPRLANNAKLDDTDWLRKVILNGRGMMPAYEAVLSEQEIDVLVQFLQENFSPLP